MITIRELAVLSSHVYESYKPDEHGIAIENFSHEVDKFIFINDGWLRITDVHSATHPADHFYAQLYLKVVSGKITDAVVAVRGTVFSDHDNLKVDLKSWYAAVFADPQSDSLPAYTDAAFLYYEHARAYVKQHLPYIHEVQLTGHSLGGAIAKALVLVYGVSTTTTVFNAPGVAGIKGGTPELGVLINNVNSRYGLINKVDWPEPYIGTILLAVPNDEALAKYVCKHFSKPMYALAKAANEKAFLDKPVGYGLEFGNLLGAITTSYTKNYKINLAKCYEHYGLTSPHASIISLALFATEIPDRGRCEFESLKSAGAGLAEMVKAQHSIDNLISALDLPANGHIGAIDREALELPA